MRLQQPFKLLMLGFKWMLTEMIIELSRIKLWVASNAIPEPDYGDLDYSGDRREVNKEVTIAKKPKKGSTVEDEEWFAMQEKKPKENETIFYPCDKRSDLYVLERSFIQHNRGYASDAKSNDSR